MILLTERTLALTRPRSTPPLIGCATVRNRRTHYHHHHHHRRTGDYTLCTAKGRVTNESLPQVQGHRAVWWKKSARARARDTAAAATFLERNAR